MRTITIIFALLLVAACSSAPTQQSANQDIQTITIGFIEPLSGDGAAYGLPIQKVTQKAVADLNAQWAPEGKQLKVVYEDGKCTAKGGLDAAQKLVNTDGVKVIYGGGCSSETLGAAPFTESNQVILFSPLSSSPDVSKAGDFVFRNYPSDTAQVAVMTEFISGQNLKKVAILSEITDYAQALRKGYQESLDTAGIEIVADETVESESRDARTQLTKIKNAEPDAIILLPQTVPMAGIFIEQLYQADIDARVYGDDLIGIDQTINEFGSEMDGIIAPSAYFAADGRSDYEAMISETNCEIGYYCATAYDGIFLLGEVISECGDDTACIKDELYAINDWSGKFTGPISIDENGDVGGQFIIRQAESSQWVRVE